MRERLINSFKELFQDQFEGYLLQERHLNKESYQNFNTNILIIKDGSYNYLKFLRNNREFVVPLLLQHPKNFRLVKNMIFDNAYLNNFVSKNPYQLETIAESIKNISSYSRVLNILAWGPIEIEVNQNDILRTNFTTLLEIMPEAFTHIIKLNNKEYNDFKKLILPNLAEAILFASNPDNFKNQIDKLKREQQQDFKDSSSSSLSNTNNPIAQQTAYSSITTSSLNSSSTEGGRVKK